MSLTGLRLPDKRRMRAVDLFLIGDKDFLEAYVAVPGIIYK